MPGDTRPTPVQPDELDLLVELIAAEQVRPDRNIPYLGDDAADIRSELDALDPPWTDTARVVRTTDGALAGATAVEWDDSIGRAWVLGPWVFGDGAWNELAPHLLDAALGQLPAGVEAEMSGEVANVRLAALAAQRGWTASGAAHVLVADEEVVSRWPANESDRLRAAVADDLDVIQPLHDAEFPNTHTPAVRMISEFATIVATADDGTVSGYAAGRIQPDGEGYIDYVGVVPAARGQGIGRLLITALAPELLDAASKKQVALVVNDDRVAARALYASLGFAPVTSMVGYRP
jgi:ribosomal protein S18 acetylase RimI-like enzyme